MRELNEEGESRDRKGEEPGEVDFYRTIIREITEAQNDQERRLEEAYEKKIREYRERKKKLAEGKKEIESQSKRHAKEIKKKEKELGKQKDSLKPIVDNVVPKTQHQQAGSFSISRAIVEGIDKVAEGASKVVDNTEASIGKAADKGLEKAIEKISTPTEKSENPEPKSEIKNKDEREASKQQLTEVDESSREHKESKEFDLKLVDLDLEIDVNLKEVLEQRGIIGLRELAKHRDIEEISVKHPQLGQLLYKLQYLSDSPPKEFCEWLGIDPSHLPGLLRNERGIKLKHLFQLFSHRPAKEIHPADRSNLAHKIDALLPELLVDKESTDHLTHPIQEKKKNPRALNSRVLNPQKNPEISNGSKIFSKKVF